MHVGAYWAECPRGSQALRAQLRRCSAACGGLNPHAAADEVRTVTRTGCSAAFVEQGGARRSRITYTGDAAVPRADCTMIGVDTCIVLHATRRQRDRPIAESNSSAQLAISRACALVHRASAIGGHGYAWQYHTHDATFERLKDRAVSAHSNCGGAPKAPRRNQHVHTHKAPRCGTRCLHCSRSFRIQGPPRRALGLRRIC